MVLHVRALVACSLQRGCPHYPFPDTRETGASRVCFFGGNERDRWHGLGFGVLSPPPVGGRHSSLWTPLPTQVPRGPDAGPPCGRCTPSSVACPWVARLPRYDVYATKSADGGPTPQPRRSTRSWSSQGTRGSLPQSALLFPPPRPPVPPRPASLLEGSCSHTLHCFRSPLLRRSSAHAGTTGATSPSTMRRTGASTTTSSCRRARTLLGSHPRPSVTPLRAACCSPEPS